MRFLLKNTKGFTLAELLVASFIFVTCMTVIATSTINFYRGSKRQLSRDTLFEETRVLVDRVVRDVRMNTIDFDEYFNQLPAGEGGPLKTAITNVDLDYGKYYREYYHHFFFIDPPTTGSLPTCPELGLNNPDRYAYSGGHICRAQHVDEGNFSTYADDDGSNDNSSLSALGTNPSETSPTLQALRNFKRELYLISPNGKQKTIIKRIGNNKDDDLDGQVDEGDATDTGQEQIGILVLDLADQYDNTTMNGPSSTPSGSADGYFDSWVQNVDFPDYTDSITPDDSPFIPISPPNIEITDVQFFISPIDDPRKAFNESDESVQVHPNVTMVITAQVSAETLRIFPSDTPPNITLQTTVSSRVYDNVLIPFEDL